MVAWVEEASPGSQPLGLSRWVEANRPCLVISRHGPTLNLLRTLLLRGAQEMGFLTFSREGRNQLIYLGKGPEALDRLIEALEASGYAVVNATAEIVEELYPVTREHLLGFVARKYTWGELYSLGYTLGVSLPYGARELGELLDLLVQGAGEARLARLVDYPNAAGFL